ncbi:MAG: NAD(P)/FAD-dependent oxidoreductase [Myxococcota bacterium]|nr:NAD(P)/FAD-dependent oxidoreductase [Myxococcota bacterium]
MSINDDKKYDLIIVGGGPAGLSAALVASSNFLSCVVIEKESTVGGQIHLADAPVLDVLGQPASNGPELIANFQAQVRVRQEIETKCNTQVIKIDRDNEAWRVECDDGAALRGKSVLLATGTCPRPWGVQGAEALTSTEHARDELAQFAGQAVAVIGGGDEASDLAVCLSKIGAKVHLLVRSTLRARPRFAEPLLAREDIKILENTVVSTMEKAGDTWRLQLSADQSLEVSEIFVRIGVQRVVPDVHPRPEFLSDGRLKIDDQGRTSVPGLYAAGDLSRRPQQWYVAVAMADGVMAARAAEDDAAV